MKILIVNNSDLYGGAARAAYRLLKSLLKKDIECQMLVQHKYSDDTNVIAVDNNGFQRKFNRLCSKIDKIPVKLYKKRTKSLFSSSWFGFNNVVNKINGINPDVVHLHWINGGMMKIEDLSKIKAPVVWSFHDMWGFTGGCHYDELCEGYKKGCGNCKVLGSGRENDLSKKVYNRKRKNYLKKENLTIVGLSKWINEISKNSPLLKNKYHINLPNPINTKIFKPSDKKESRELWGLPQEKKLMLFGAMGADSDPRKGFEELSHAIKKLDDENIEFVVFGNDGQRKTKIFGHRAHYLGKITDDSKLITLYSAVDVTVVPSIQENLSNVIMESLACGTPAVGFDIGGNRDMIEHRKNGYLATPFSADDFGHGIKWVLNNEHYEDLCRNSIAKVKKEFDSEVVVHKYIDLYKELVRRS